MHLRFARALLATSLMWAACGADPSAPGDPDAATPDAATGDDLWVGDTGPAPDDTAVAPDTDAPPDTAGPDDTAVAPDTTAPPDTTPPPPSGTLALALVTEGGVRDVEPLVLYPEDEPLAFATDEHPGFQVGLVVSTTDVAAGEPVSLWVAGAFVGTAAVVVDGATTAGQALFEGVTLPSGASSLVVEVTDALGDLLSVSRDVEFVDSPCAIAVAQAVSDACLTVDADPEVDGFQARFIVTHVGGDCGPVALTAEREGGDLVAEPTGFGGADAIELTLTLSPDSALEGDVVVRAAAPHPHSPALVGLASVTVRVDTIAPAPAFVQPDPAFSGPLTHAHDADADPESGLQLALAVDAGAEDVVAVELTVGDLTLEDVAPDGLVWAFPPQTLVGDGPVTFAAAALDACGNIGEIALTRDVYATIPRVALVTPADGAVLLARDNADPAETSRYLTTFIVSVHDARPAMVATVTCRADVDAAPVELASHALDAPADHVELALDVTLDTAVLGHTPTCAASVTWPNPATAAAHDLTLAIPAPTLGLTTPADGARVNTRAIPLFGTATSLDGRPVRVEVADAAGAVLRDVSLAGVDAGAFAVIVDGGDAPFADGTYTVRVDATDGFGNVVSDTQAAPSRVVHLDATPPTVALVAPSAAVLDPVADAAHVDEDPATPGYQTTLVWRLDGEAIAEGATLCPTVADVPLPCRAPAADTFTASWTVTLTPGATTLTATGRDAWDNPSAAASSVVTLALDAPVVTIASPPPGLVTAAETVDVTVQVAAVDDGTPIDGADVTLLLAGAPVDAAPAPLGGGAYLFEAVPLAPGATQELRAIAVFSSVEGVSAERVVTQKDVAPALAVTSPADGAVLSLASDACVGAQTDCVTSVTLDVVAVEADRVVTLTALCGDDEATFSQPAGDGGELVFADVTLAHGGACAISAHAIDAAGQHAAAVAVAVTVDRVAPRVVGVASPSGSTLLHVHDQRPGVPGMQAPLRVRVAGVEAGQEIAATMSWLDAEGEPASRTLVHVVAADIADDADALVSFSDADLGQGLVHYPEGPVSLRFALADAAGNGAERVHEVLVETNAPAARFTSPAWLGDATCDTASPCASGVCHDGRCWRGWGVADSKLVVVDVAGLVTTADNVRVCSDAPALADHAPACGAAGYHQVALASSTGGVVVFDLVGLPEAPQRLIAEVLPVADGAWVASLASDAANAQRRDVYVDLTRPVVTAVTSPSDALAPLGVLSAAEQSGAGRRYLVRVTADEDGPVTFWANGQSAASATVVGGEAEVELALLEGANTVYARVTDLVGNVSVGAASAELVRYEPHVDTVAPGLAFAAPASSPIVMGQPRDVRVTSDEEGAEVAIFDAGVAVATGVITNGEAVFAHDVHGLLADGQRALTATISDAAHNTTTVATSPATVIVDTTPPAALIASPSDFTTLTAADDPYPDTPAIEVPVSFVAWEGAETWTLRVAPCDTADWSCGAAAVVATGVVTTEGESIAREVALSPFAAVSGFRVELTARDAVNNAVVVATHVEIVVQDCVVAVSGLGAGPWLGLSDCGDGEGCVVQVAVTASGENCGAVDGLTLVSGETVVGESDALVAGAASFALPLVHDTAPTLRGLARVGSVVVAESAPVTRTVDLEAPQVTASLVAQGAPHASGVYRGANDTSATAGFQLDVEVTAIDTNLAGGAIARISRLAGGVDVDAQVDAPALPHDLTFQFATVTVAGVTLLDGADNRLTVHVRDAAGNVGTAEVNATVDATPPAALALLPVAPEDVDPRRPAVTVRWSAVADNGAVGGPAASYEVRYSRSPIADAAAFDAACRATDLAHGEALPTPGAAGAAEAFLLTGPDPRPHGDPCKLAAASEAAPLYVAARAIDAVGNVGPLSAASVTSTDALVHRVSHIRFTPAFAAATGLSAMQAQFLGAGGANVGDVDGDGADDFASGFFLSNAFCLFFSGAVDGDYDLEAATGPHHRCVIGAASVVPDGGASGLGTHFDALGDVNGDGFDDFGVSGKTGGASAFVAIYLGGPDGPALDAPDVVVRGIAGLSGPYGGFCGAGNFDAQIDPVAYDDIAIGEPAVDRLRVIPGRAEWTPGQPTVVIDLGAPDVEATWGIATFEAQFGEVAWFGNRCRRAGDVLPTPDGGPAAGDLLVHQASNEDSRLFVIPGRPLVAGATHVLTRLDGAPSVEDGYAVRLRQDPNGAGGYASGFGSTFEAADVDGDGVSDVIVGHTGRSTSVAGADGKAVFIFDGQSIAAAQGQDLRVGSAAAPKVGRAWAGTHGAVLEADVNSEFRGVAAIGDFDGWTWGATDTIDLGICDKGFSRVELRYNHETDAGDEALGLFPYRESVVANPDASGQFSAGMWVEAVGDVDGDGRADAVIGTAMGSLLLLK